MKASPTRAARRAAEVAASPPPADGTRCPHTAALAALLADDAYGLVELLTDLIGEAVEYTNELDCARVKLARMGMVAQQIRAAHRTDGYRNSWFPDAVHWVLSDGGADGYAEAWDALARKAAP